MTEREKMYQERLAICKGCEHFDPTYKRCRKCGCFTQIKGRVKTASCPLGKWPVKKK